MAKGKSLFYDKIWSHFGREQTVKKRREGEKKKKRKRKRKRRRRGRGRGREEKEKRKRKEDKNGMETNIEYESLDFCIEI